MPLAPELLTVLACPESKQPLVYFADGETGSDPGSAFFLCPASRLRYRIDGDVPVLLVDEAERLDPKEVDRLLTRAKQLGIAGV